MTFGFGASATLRLEAIASLAATCELLGYDSFWLNVAGSLQGTRGPDGGVPEGAPEWKAVGAQHPVDMLAAAVDATSNMTVGIGLAPLDVFPASSLIDAARRRSWPRERAILGIAAGHPGAKCGNRVSDGLAELRAANLPLLLGSGGRGPVVLRTSGAAADAICLAWLTPAGLAEAMDHIRTGASRAGRDVPPVYVYVRVGLGEGGEERVRTEMSRYARLPHHTDNRDALGRAELIGAAIASPSELPAALQPHRLGRPVIRPVLAAAGELAAWEEAARLLAPNPPGPGAPAPR